jgi:hypothetical protein
MVELAIEIPLVQPSDQHVAATGRLGYRVVLGGP